MSHALLAPSSAHRWLTCPPSARLEKQFPDVETTAAAEGTFAHKYAETTLQHFYKRGDVNNEPLKENKFYNGDLEENVSTYTNTVIEKFNLAKSKDKGAALYLEKEFDLSEFVPASYGRADAVIICDDSIEIIDLKYGAGIAVRAKDNPQLRLYALGVYSELSFLYDDIKQVTVTIIQPRNGGISSDTLTVDELLEWGEKIKPIAQMAYVGDGDFKAGDHCKFCKAANRCKALAEYQMKAVKTDFDDPDLLTDGELIEILSAADDTIKWLNSIKTYMLDKALNDGKSWEGFKLVAGRSVRKIVDAEKAAEILKDNGGTDEQIWKPKELLGITALEKNFGKKKLAEMLKTVIDKPAGAPTLVPVTDPREELHNVQNDFDKLEE